MLDKFLAGAGSMLSARGAGQAVVLLVVVLVVLTVLEEKAKAYTPAGLSARLNF